MVIGTSSFLNDGQLNIAQLKHKSKVFSHAEPPRFGARDQQKKGADSGKLKIDHRRTRRLSFDGCAGGARKRLTFGRPFVKFRAF
ncbi:MAG: hypothetical protein KAR36_08270, partial [Candidatus Latescibacteria bacterium]|nr:hypothetical protein [Candidatus Latescibacterota bacterium]